MTEEERALNRPVITLARAISDLTGAVRVLVELIRSACQPLTLSDLKEMEHRLMSKITDWAAKEQADLSAISATLDGIVKGIADLNQKITDLQNSPGTLTPEDQAALDDIQGSVQQLAAKSAAITVNPAPPTTASARQPSGTGGTGGTTGTNNG